MMFESVSKIYPLSQSVNNGLLDKPWGVSDVNPQA